MSTIANPWAVQARAFRAALDTDVHTLIQLGGLRLFFAVAEPLLAIGVALCWHTLMQVQSPYGSNRALFLVSGFLPVHLFVKISSEFRVASKKAGDFRHYPAETMLDVVMAASLVNLAIYTAASAVGLCLLYIFETRDALPFDMYWVFVSLFQMFSLGFAVGLCNAAIEQVTPVWRSVWLGVGRALILFSGIFYVPSFLPVFVRDIMSWNPVMQGVETFRFSIYPGYPRDTYFPLFSLYVTLALLMLGLIGERMLRRYRQFKST